MDWVIWLGIAVVLAIVEITNVALVFAMLAVGALAASVTALFTDNVVVQTLVAVVVSLAMLFVVRPIALRHMRTPRLARTGVAGLVGERGVVTSTVDARGGRVKLKGEEWSARSYDPTRVIEPGHDVHVMQIDGATAVVL